MKSTVTIEINLPQARVAELFSNPRLTTRWMHDVDRVEVVSGELGAVGSQYRLVPKKGNMVFLATVLARDLSKHSRLRLDGSNMVVSVTGTFQSLSATKTLLVSSECSASRESSLPSSASWREAQSRRPTAGI